jgi:ABC-type dipeptide/oligopeptide/nickel transport system ATPase component
VQAEILDLLRRLQRERDMAMMLISHVHRGEIVEQGPTDRVTDYPQHPYTKTLLAAVPLADPVHQAARRVS